MQHLARTYRLSKHAEDFQSEDKHLRREDECEGNTREGGQKLDWGGGVHYRTVGHTFRKVLAIRRGFLMYHLE